MTAIRTYEVLCSWIESATTKDHLVCVANYINNVFVVMFPPTVKNVLDQDVPLPLHQEMVDEMFNKIRVKEQAIITID